MATPEPSDPLTIQNLTARFKAGEWTAAAVAEECLRRIEAHNDPAIWTSLFPREEILAAARKVDQRRAAGERHPLLGVPFAIKDNIDMAGHPTTAACPDFSYRPARSATVVQRLIDLGAVPIGKTNLDQFATGLVGTRSPYGTPRNPFNRDYIPGGSSSGSAVAVSAGLVAFALGTDTAGSGRVPAAFNNIVGLKPTRGWISAGGVVPACRSIDCVSIFALTCSDAAEVLDAVIGYDPLDPYSRGEAQIQKKPGAFPTAFRFGVPAGDQLKFFGNDEAKKLFESAIARLEELGGRRVEIDFAPFIATGSLLYDGAWVAERLAGLRHFVSARPESVLPTTRAILQSAERFDGVAVFDCIQKLHTLRRATEAEWAKMDVLALPTTGTIYSLAQIEAEPIKRNADLGLYTTFTNLLDLCAVSVPGRLMPNGLPVGAMLTAPAGYDVAILELAGRLHATVGLNPGAPGSQADAANPPVRPPAMGLVRLAVVGAHLSAQPLNHQLTDVGATLLRACRTAHSYRLFALANTKPAKPGLVRILDGTGVGIEVEVWEMTVAGFGRFVAGVPQPMAIGNIRLEDGEEVKGFLCEPCAIVGARDISQFGGWRNYLRAASRGEAADAR